MAFLEGPQRRSVITALAVGGGLVVLAAWPALARVFLVAFAAILGALLLDGITRLIASRLPVPRGLILAAVLAAFLGALAGVVLLAGPRLTAQFDLLQQEFPAAVQTIKAQIEEVEWLSKIFAAMPSGSELMSQSSLVGSLTDVFVATLEGVAGGVLIAVLAVFIAVSPTAYWTPALRLIRPERRETAQALADEIATNLRSWLAARFLSMVAVGILTGVGLWLIDVPAPATLGLIAGLLSFIPNLGPILGAVPGVALAFVEGPMTALWAASVYAGVQVLEGNLITPLAERQAVDVPPAFLLCGQLLIGLLTGVLGLLVATPLIVVGVICVRRLYVDRIERVAVTTGSDALDPIGGLDDRAA